MTADPSFCSFGNPCEHCAASGSWAYRPVAQEDIDRARMTLRREPLLRRLLAKLEGR